MGSEMCIRDRDRPHRPQLLNRLSHIEGQARGVAPMVEEGRYCSDILTQVQAARAALARVEGELLRDQFDHGIEGAVVSGGRDEQRKEAAQLIELLERATR